MATVEQCEQALHQLADRLAASSESARHASFDRTLSCTLRDLDVVFTARLHAGRLESIARATSANAQIRLDLTSDDLVALVDGSLKTTSALTAGRLRVKAGIADLLRLKSIF